MVAVARSERWRVVREFPKYEVSDRGRVRRLVVGSGTRKGRVLKPSFTGGYAYVSMPGVNRLVHLLVARAFLRPRKGYEVDHLNADKRDNRVTNLEYVTPLENVRRAVAKGLLPTGEQHYRAVLTDDLVRELRQRVANGESVRSMRGDYDVSYQTLCEAARGDSWQHVSMPGGG